LGVSERDGAWDAIVEMRGGTPGSGPLLPLARLLEVAIHHVDLDIGYEISDLDPQTAEWLLEWCSFRLRSRVEFPKLELRSDSGFSIRSAARRTHHISGTSAQPARLVMNRVDASAVRGDEPATAGFLRRTMVTAMHDHLISTVIDVSVGRCPAAMSREMIMDGRGHVEPGGPAPGRAAVIDRDHDQDQRRADGQQRLPATTAYRCEHPHRRGERP
jgi:hypothetical protein